MYTTLQRVSPTLNVIIFIMMIVAQRVERSVSWVAWRRFACSLHHHISHRHQFHVDSH